MLGQGKSSWSKNTSRASADALTGFGNESSLRHRLSYVCGGLLGGGGCGFLPHCIQREEEAVGKQLQCPASAAKVAWGLKCRFFLLVKNMSVSVVTVICGKRVGLLCCDLGVDLVCLCTL